MMNECLRSRMMRFMAVLSVCALAVPTAKADSSPVEVWVCDGTGSDETGLGTSDSPFKTIQKGVDAVAVAREGQIKGWAVLQKSAPAPGLWRVDLGKPNTGPRKYFQLDVTGVPGFLWLSGEKTVSFR